MVLNDVPHIYTPDIRLQLGSHLRQGSHDRSHRSLQDTCAQTHTVSLRFTEPTHSELKKLTLTNGTAGIGGRSSWVFTRGVTLLPLTANVTLLVRGENNINADEGDRKDVMFTSVSIRPTKQ